MELMEYPVMGAKWEESKTKSIGLGISTRGRNGGRPN
jgi:hypothetical protein